MPAQAGFDGNKSNILWGVTSEYIYQFWLKKLLNELNPAGKIPDRKQFSDSLLDEIYPDLKSQVEVVVDNTPNINFITDRSSNVNHEHITNLFAYTWAGMAYLLSEKDQDHVSHSAKNLAIWIEEKTTTWTKNCPERIKSFTTDAAASMKKIEKLLNDKPE